jgi:PAS domain S-box-containing protein
MSIRTKLTIMFLAIALIPLLLVTTITFDSYKDSLKANRLSQLENLASFTTDKIETYFAGLKTGIKIVQDSYIVKKSFPVVIQLAHDPANPKFLAARKMLDEGILQKMPSSIGLFDIMLVNPDGRVYYTSNPEHYPKDFLNLLSGPEQKAFEEGKNKVYFSDIFLNKAQGNKPGMLVTAPAFDFKGVFIGVIVFEVDMSHVYKIIQDVTGLGNTGETLVAKKTGNEVLYLNPLRHNPQAALSLRVRIGDKIGRPMQQAVQGGSGVGLAVDYRGKSVVSAWRYIPFLDWGVVAKIDADEAFGDIENLKKLVVMILIIISALAGIMAFSIAQSVAGPIKKLSQAAQIIGSGNLDYKLEINSKDETGQLSRAFDKMSQDLKGASAARDAERKRFNDVLNMLPAYVVLLTPDYHVPFANRFFEERFGKSHGKCCYDYLFHRTEPCENCETYKVVKTNAPHHWEWTGPDNRNYDIYDFPFTDADGSPLIMEMGIDITEQKRAQESLRQVSQYARNLIETSLDPLVTISSEGKITDVNEATIRATGLTRQELIGTDFSNYFTEPEKAQVGYRQVFAKGFVTDYSLTIRHKDGRLMDVLYNASVYKDTHGNVLGVFAAARDVTLQKQAEAELRRHKDNLEVLVKERTSQLESAIMQLQEEITERKKAEDALKESETKYRIVSDNTSDFEFWLSPEGKYIYASPSCRELTGYGPEDFIINPTLTRKIVHPDDLPVFVAHVENTESKKAGELEFRIIRSDGAIRWMSHVCLPVYDEKGLFLGIRGSNRDITERKKAEEELKRSNENLEQFAYVASHDLQEPLRIMASFSELLGRRYNDKLDTDANEFIGYIVAGAKHMQRLISDLLAYSRVGRIDMLIGEIDCNSILGRVINSMMLATEENKAVITHDELPTLTGSESNFIQLFQNLIGNALKFHGPDLPRVHVSAEKQHGDWVFSVKDNGIGIEPQYKDRIFLIFQRLHEREKYPGTGMGLSICKKIVETQGGRIWVESEHGKGSTFYFTIPATGGLKNE